jgi:hypothetical protein
MKDRYTHVLGGRLVYVTWSHIRSELIFSMLFRRFFIINVMCITSILSVDCISLHFGLSVLGKGCFDAFLSSFPHHRMNIHISDQREWGTVKDVVKGGLDIIYHMRSQCYVLGRSYSYLLAKRG